MAVGFSADFLTGSPGRGYDDSDVHRNGTINVPPPNPYDPLPVLCCHRMCRPVPGGHAPFCIRADHRHDLQTPYSFVTGASGKDYFISSVNGEPDTADNNGFIT